MEQDRINYNDVIKRGFKRKDLKDDVFESINGYGWFIVTKKLTKTIQLDWDCETHFIELLRTDKTESEIKGRIYIVDLDHLDQIIRFFESDTPDIKY